MQEDYNIFTFGNEEILKERKIGFLCSRRVPSSVILKSYDWAIEQRDNGICVVSGFHSQIEKDVLHYLLKGTQPIIFGLTRGLKKKYTPEIQNAIDDGRLLVVTPFEKNVIRVNKKNAVKRNKFIFHFVDSVVVAHANRDGKLSGIVDDLFLQGKIKYLDK